MKKFFVYEIAHPDTGLPFYVGMTSTHPQIRLEAHARAGSIVGQYIRVLLRIQKIPAIRVIKEFDSEDDAHLFEIDTIHDYMSRYTILNYALYVGTPPVAELCGAWGEYCKKVYSCVTCGSIEYAWRFHVISDALKAYEQLYFYDDAKDLRAIKQPKEKYRSLSFYIGKHLACATETMICDNPFHTDEGEAILMNTADILEIIKSEKYMFPYQKLKHGIKFDWWVKGKFDAKVDFWNSLSEEEQSQFLVDFDKMGKNIEN